jgi:hypothetical protein
MIPSPFKMFVVLVIHVISQPTVILSCNDSEMYQNVSLSRMAKEDAFNQIQHLPSGAEYTRQNVVTDLCPARPGSALSHIPCHTDATSQPNVLRLRKALCVDRRHFSRDVAQENSQPPRPTRENVIGRIIHPRTCAALALYALLFVDV